VARPVWRPRSSRANRRVAGRLKPFLDPLFLRYGHHGWLDSDPISLPHGYSDDADREVVAFISAMLAFGNVTAMLDYLKRLFGRLGEHPAEVIQGSTADTLTGLTRGLKYRWITEEDASTFLAMIGGVLRRFGSLEGAFRGGLPGQVVSPHEGLRSLRSALLEAGGDQGLSLERRGTRYLVSGVEGTGACKRYNLYLRWMVRSDDVDLGLWQCLTPAQLIIPVDTHIARISRYIGLTSRDVPDMKMAKEITETLRFIDPEDPTKYDFALCRLGILGACPKRRNPVTCDACSLLPVCQL
jgi:uncharacterized protein (TIGR02757 family)